MSDTDEFKSWEEIVAYCKGILEKFRPKHKRIKIFIGFEVEPAVWSDCPHAENPKKALCMAKKEDKYEEWFLKARKMPSERGQRNEKG